MNGNPVLTSNDFSLTVDINGVQAAGIFAGEASAAATAAAASAASVSTSAATASAEAAAASASAASAAIDATNAAASATAAATNASALQAGLASFEQTWLGSLTADPTVNPTTGAALVVGAEYLNTTVVPPTVRVYTSTGWQDQDATAEAASANASLAATQAAASAASAASSQTAATASAATATTQAANASASATAAETAETGAQAANTAAQAAASALIAMRGSYTFTATAGQTSWSQSGVSWPPGDADVFVNGARWNRTESFSDSTGDSIAFNNPLVEGYEVAVVIGISVVFPVIGVSSEALALATAGNGANMVGLTGANGNATTVAALASSATGNGDNLIAHSATQTVAQVIDPDLQSAAATLTGAEEQTVKQGGAFVKTTLTTNAQWALQEYFGFTQNGVSAAARPVSSKEADRLDIRDWVVDLTGDNDETSVLTNAMAQSAASGEPLNLPAGVLAMQTSTTGLEIPPGCVLQGPGMPFGGLAEPGRLNFHLVGTGKGFSISGTGSPNGTRVVRGIGTYRDQGTPGTGWTPAANDWDFYLDGASDVLLEDIMLFNPTLGITQTLGGGRNIFRNVRGQPLQVGIQIDTSYDTFELHGLHFWPFWSQDPNVLAWVAANGTSFYSKRNDNSMLNNLHAHGYQYFLRIGQWTSTNPDLPSGTTNSMKLVNADVDTAQIAVYHEAGADGATAQISNLSCSGIATVTNTPAIALNANNADISIDGFRAAGIGSSVAIVNGTGNTLTLRSVKVDSWNTYLASQESPAFSAVAGNTIDVSDGNTRIGTGGGAEIIPDSSAGIYYTNALRGYTPAITVGTGALGGTTINYARWRICGGLCYVNVSFTVSSVGTAVGGLYCGLPVPVGGVAGSRSMGAGREVATTGEMLSVTASQGSTTMEIEAYDNGTVISAGGNYCVSLQYQV